MPKSYNPDEEVDGKIKMLYTVELSADEAVDLIAFLDYQIKQLTGSEIEKKVVPTLEAIQKMLGLNYELSQSHAEPVEGKKHWDDRSKVVLTFDYESTE